jgi:putative flippase GtrA
MVKTQLLRFVAVGVLNTGFSYSVYLVLIWLGLHFSLANLLATVVGILFSFRTQGALVFSNQSWHLFRRFAFVWLLVYLVNVSFIALLVHAGLGAALAGLVAIPPTVLLSFLLQRRFVFTNSRGGEVSVES